MKSWSVAAAIVIVLTPTPAVEVLHPSARLSEALLATFKDPAAYIEASTGEALVLDRRLHAVFKIDRGRTQARRILDIGVEAGKVIRPSGMAMGPEDMFAIADVPSGLTRIQYFQLDGRAVGGFYVPDRVLNPVTPALGQSASGAIQFSGSAFFISMPGRGSLVSELDIHGANVRQIGELRPTGHESDPALHLALNAGLPLVDPRGGFYYVFTTGVPMFRKYDANGVMLFERHIEGREIDAHVQALPTVWPARAPEEGLHPYTAPLIRTAAVDSTGHLWISLLVPYTYVYDANGDKIRTVQFDLDGPLKPDTFFFAARDRLLVTPGCLEFSAK